MDHPCHVCFKLADWFQKRRLLNNFPIGSYVKTMSVDDSHFEPRSGSLNTILEVDHLRTIDDMFATARTARFSKKSLGSDVGEINKMSEKLKIKSVFTPRNVQEKLNTMIYYKTPTLTIKRREIKKWDINLYLYICMFLRLSFF